MKKHFVDIVTITTLVVVLFGVCLAVYWNRRADPAVVRSWGGGVYTIGVPDTRSLPKGLADFATSHPQLRVMSVTKEGDRGPDYGVFVVVTEKK